MLRATLVFFRSKVFTFGMPDHGKPGLRHVTPHVFLSRIFCAAIRRHSAALARYSSTLLTGIPLMMRRAALRLTSPNCRIAPAVIDFVRLQRSIVEVRRIFFCSKSTP